MNMVRHIRAGRRLFDVHHDALAIIAALAPSLWVRDERHRHWLPARPMDDPPMIPNKIMVALIDEELVEIRSYTLKGAIEAVRFPGEDPTTSCGAAIRFQLGRLTASEPRV